MVMEKQQIKQLMLIRVAVGLLGEQSTLRWWKSAFCGNNAKAFLAPIFPRTFVHAQCQGVVSAAALVHDDRIGVGNVFHLFRLPEDMEHRLRAATGDGDTSAISEIMKDVDSATEFLSHYAGGSREPSPGPVKVGGLSALRNLSIWKDVAALYLGGFANHQETFPFFSDGA